MGEGVIGIMLLYVICASSIFGCNLSVGTMFIQPAINVAFNDVLYITHGWTDPAMLLFRK